VTVAPAAFSPNADGRKDRLTLPFTLARPATWSFASSGTAGGSRARFTATFGPGRTVHVGRLALARSAARR
jgi:hypothetical protein